MLVEVYAHLHEKAMVAALRCFPALSKHACCVVLTSGSIHYLCSVEDICSGLEGSQMIVVATQAAVSRVALPRTDMGLPKPSTKASYS